MIAALSQKTMIAALLLATTASALAPSHLTPQQQKRFAKVEAQLRETTAPLLIDGNNIRAALGWTRTTTEVQTLVDDWAVATSRRCVTCWDYGDAFAAAATAGGAAVFSGRDALADDALAQALAYLDCACLLVTSDTNLIARCRARRDVATLRSQDFGWALEAAAGPQAWGERRPARKGESSRTRKREARALLDALRGPTTDAGDAVARLAAWIEAGRPGLRETTTRRGNVLYEVDDETEAAPPPRRARDADLESALAAIDAYRRPRDLVVVEGSHDAAAVAEACPSASTLALNGSALGPGKAAVVAARAAACGGRVVVLLDPDFTGLHLRSAVDRVLGDALGTGWFHAFVPEEAATLRAKGARSNKRAGDVGLEHAASDVVADALRGARPYAPGRAAFSREDLVAWGLADGPGAEDRRAAVCRRLGFGLCSAKPFLRVLNTCSFHREDVDAALDACDAADAPPPPAGAAPRAPNAVEVGAAVAVRLDDSWCRGVVLSRVASGQNRGRARVRCDGRHELVVHALSRRSYGRDWVAF